MTTALAVISVASDLVVQTLLREKVVLSNHLVVLTNNKQSYQKLEKAGIFAYYIQPPNPDPVAKKDADFADFAMPGILGKNTFHTTDLPTYKVLGIDRLRFWYNKNINEYYLDHIQGLEFDRLILSLDFYDTFPWIAHLSASQDVYQIAVKTHSLRTREVLNSIRTMLFDEAVVSYPSDLNLVNAKKRTLFMSTNRKRPVAIPDETRKQLKENLGIKSDTVVGLLFDPKYEYNFRRFITSLTIEGANPPRLVAFYTDNRSRALLYKCLPHRIFGLLGIDTYQLDMLGVCDQLFMFAFDENVYYQSPENIRLVVVDYNNINLSKELAFDDVEVLID